jgi:hypothetical protein
MSITALAALLGALAFTMILALGLAWVPMRLLIGRMARSVRQVIERQRDRRRVARGTPDRRQAG